MKPRQYSKKLQKKLEQVRTRMDALACYASDNESESDLDLGSGSPRKTGLCNEDPTPAQSGEASEASPWRSHRWRLSRSM
jgi:hypothetical protein